MIYSSRKQKQVSYVHSDAAIHAEAETTASDVFSPEIMDAVRVADKSLIQMLNELCAEENKEFSAFAESVFEHKVLMSELDELAEDLRIIDEAGEFSYKVVK